MREIWSPCGAAVVPRQRDHPLAQQAQEQRPACCLSAAPGSQGFPHVPNVRLDGPTADPQDLGDLMVPIALSCKAEAFRLPLSEMRHSVHIQREGRIDGSAAALAGEALHVGT